MEKYPLRDHHKWSEKDLLKRLAELHLLKLDAEADLAEAIRTAEDDSVQARRIIPLQRSLAAIVEEVEKINSILGERDRMVE